MGAGGEVIARISRDPARKETRPAGLGGDQARVAAFLRPGERLLWSGKPDPRLDPQGWMSGCAGVPLTLFGLGFGALVLSGPLSGGGASVKMLLFFGIMGLIPLTMVFFGLLLLTQPIRNRRRAHRSIHALTDERLMTLTRWGTKDELTSIGLDQLGPMNIAVGANGRGTIAIDTHTTRDNDGHRQTQSYALLGIDDAQAVHDRILALKAERGLA